MSELPRREFPNETHKLSRSQPFVPGQLRIAIVGGGVAGLSSAYALRQLGYSNVTVFEKAEKPAGKVLTDSSLGTPIEMGAVFATDASVHTLHLARELGAPTAPLKRDSSILDLDGTVVPDGAFAVRKYGEAPLARAIDRYKALSAQHRVMERRGFAGLSQELDVPFEEFAEKNGIMPFADMLRVRLVSYGYAYYENVPAMYYLKAIGSLGSGQLVYFTRGYQDLWVRVAERLDVRCSANVSAIRRRITPDGPRIEVEVNGEEHVFDRLIVATPCRSTACYLDLTNEERDLFAQVVDGNYHVTVAEVSGLPPDRTNLYSYANTRPTGAGHVATWYDPAPSRPIFAAYQNVAESQTDVETRRLLEEDFAILGGASAVRVLLHQKWNNFEHVESHSLADDFYEKFEALQGQKGTYYVTGLLAWEGVEVLVRYAGDLVKEMFVPAPTHTVGV